MMFIKILIKCYTISQYITILSGALGEGDGQGTYVPNSHFLLATKVYKHKRKQKDKNKPLKTNK